MPHKRWIPMLLVVGMLTPMLGCAHGQVTNVKPPLFLPPSRPPFTSPLTPVESRWIVDLAKSQERNCATIQTQRIAADPKEPGDVTTLCAVK